MDIKGVFGNRVFKLLRNCGVVAIVVLALAVVSAVYVFGQSATGTLTGTVTDPKGLAMVGVNVTVHNVDTGTDMKPVTTNDSGIYQVPLLPPGTYDVTAAQAGFASLQSKGVVVQVGSTVRLDIEMQLAGTQSLVTVTAETPLLETEKTEQSQNVSENLVSNLPISSRRWEQFVLLTPGLTADGTAGGISFHGVSSMYNNNSVDGANNNNSFDAGARGGASKDGYVYSGDSIREFQVSSSGSGAEIGQSAGGSVNAVTRSGTSAFHGDLFYNGRAANFNALDPASKYSAAKAGTVATASVHQQHQWGGSLGGPLIKDRLFFYVTDDGYRKVNPFINTSANYSPSLACPTAITAAQCAAAKSFITSNFVGTFAQHLRQDIEFIKLDYQANQANHISAVGNIRDWHQPNASLVNGQGNNDFVQDRFVILNWTTVISNSKVNEFRYQWGRDNAFTNPNGSVPSVNVQNFFNYLASSTIPTLTNETRQQFSDSFSFTQGKHSVKVGVDYNRITDLRRSGTPSVGRYTYSTAVGTIAGCGTGTVNLLFCDWLVDLYGVTVPGDTVGSGQHWTQYSQLKDARFPGNQLSSNTSGAGNDTQHFSDWAGFVQDTWKVKSNLTVNLGFRYDVQFAAQPPGPNVRTPLLALYTSKVNIDYTGYQPRIGAAWNFTPKSVVRFGAGVYVAKTPGSTYNAALRTNGIREQSITCTAAQAAASANSGLTPCGGLHFPDVLFSQQTVAPAPLYSGVRAPLVLNPTGDLCALNPLNCSIRGFSPNDKRPRTYQLEVAFEQQLPGNLNFSASLVHSRGVFLPGHWDANLSAPAGLKAYDIVDSVGNPQFTTNVPFFLSTNRIDTSVGALLAEFSVVNSRYTALVLTARKPMSHGVEVLFNYTRSRATDNGMPFASLGQVGSQLEGQQILNPYDRTIAQSYSGSDTPNRMTTSVVWTPAFGKNSTGAVKMLVDGWNLASAITATNGTRYSALVASANVQCLTKGFSGGTGANACVGPVGADGGMMASVLMNTSVPGTGNVTFLPRSSFRLPSYTNVDLRLAKVFRITERYNFEVRGEAFNLFNSVLVLGVNANAYDYVNPSASSATCPSATHTNTCMVKRTDFQQNPTTGSNLLGARQLQAGIRFNF